MTYIIISHILWILYSFFEGVREANSKHHKEFSKSLTDVKSTMIYNLQRGLVLIIISLNLLSHISWWASISTLSMALMFPYIHNGTYFLMRNKLNPSIFTKGPCEDCSNKEEQPTMYLIHNSRTKLALIGLIIQIAICFIK
jgi:hypothetical protein